MTHKNNLQTGCGEPELFRDERHDGVHSEVAPAHNRTVEKSELEERRAMLLRQQEGWRYLEEERVAIIRATVTKDAMPALQDAWEYAQTQPHRLESGFTEFYRALSRGVR